MAAKQRRHPMVHDKRIGVPEITTWIRMVENGEVETCLEQKALVKYVRQVFATEELYVDKAKLARYIGYEKYFPFKLAPEQKFLIALWLCTYDKDDLPRWPDLFLYICRGWGKTAFAAFLAFCLMSPANGIQYYDVDICATVESQAKIGYDDIWRLFESDPDLFHQGFDWNKVEAFSLDTQSRFKYWSGNSNSKDGMRSGCVIFDEVHAYESNSSMEVFTGGLGKKPEPRRLFTTTDGEVRDGPLDEKKEVARGILFDGDPDDGLLPFMCKLDNPDEINDESKWPKANPRISRSKSLLAEYRKEVSEWKKHPAKHPMVPTKRFNLPTGNVSVEVTSWDNLVAASRPVDRERLREKPCVLGIDYAKTTDMVGACLLFKEGDERLVIPHGWWCTRSADAGEVKAPLQEWAAMGELDIETGVEISPESVVTWAKNQASILGATIQCVAIDNYRFTLMRKALEEILGIDPTLRGEDQQLWETRPSDIMKAQPVIESAFVNHQIAWGDSPLMRWATNNAKLEPAPNNCWKYGKIEPHSRKTDPFFALVHAFCVEDKIKPPVSMQFAAPVFF